MTREGEPAKEAEITLGRMLYYDTRLSAAGDISCNSCHDLEKYGVDGLATSPGHNGQKGNRNSPTVYNAALYIAQFWDGRSPDVEDQARGPIMNPIEMAMGSEEEAAARLKAVPEYQELFAQAFPDQDDPVTLDNAARAIAAFERGLVTPAPFDKFLAGDLEALDAAQLKGLDTFISAGCVTCHSGAGVGGEMFQKMGLKEPYPTKDEGRAEATGEETDKFVFKVPSLRNITQTGPYLLHDGGVDKLDETVKLMSHHQSGRELSEEQLTDILAFLGYLTGELPKDYIAQPAMPQEGAPEQPAE